MIIDDSDEAASEIDAEIEGIRVVNPRDFDELSRKLLAFMPPVKRTASRWFLYNGRTYDAVDDEWIAVLAGRILARCYWQKKDAVTGKVTDIALLPTSSTISEALKALVRRDGVRVHGEPDQNTDELIVANGRVQLATGELLPHSPDVWATKMTALAYEPDAIEPAARERWRAHLDSLALGRDMLDYLQRALGYSLTGRGTEKAFFFLYGKPHTGKSTLVFCAIDVLGKTTSDVPGYCAQTNADAWIEQRNPGASGHTDALMPIAGARLVYVDETPEACRFNSGLLKNCTNGMGAQNKIRLSAKKEKGFDAPTCFALWLSSNHMPGTQDEGTLSRLKLIVHEKTIENPDPAFFRKFMTPAMRAVVLEWLIEGARRYIAEGLAREPAAIIANRADYQADHDLLGMFLAECCVRRKTSRPGISSSELRKAYIQWAEDNAVKSIPSPVAWTKQLRERWASERGIELYKQGGTWAFRGVGLKSDYQPDGDYSAGLPFGDELD